MRDKAIYQTGNCRFSTAGFSREQDKFPCLYSEINISDPSAMGLLTIGKRNILKFYHGKIPPAENMGEATAQNTTKQQNKISTTSARFNLS